MAYVKVDENEPLEKSIKRFKRMVEKEGHSRNRSSASREWSRRKASSASGRSVSTTRSLQPSSTARTRLLQESR